MTQTNFLEVGHCDLSFQGYLGVEGGVVTLD
jgi:hypothetical protein